MRVYWNGAGVIARTHANVGAHAVDRFRCIAAICACAETGENQTVAVRRPEQEREAGR
ncbi:hypothetical protein [Paenibacillus flagellatus]|uniref:hypothetical protein n=1 Tax=Paenibacillus flagellatus TaxID=2211139 RepID=UPI00130526CD|nr:hypothetical protein [Paenibacillus flagellatus]